MRRGSDVDHLAGHPAIDHEVLAGDEAGLAGQQPRAQAGDVVGPADAAHRVLAVVGARQLRRAALIARGELVGRDPARADAVDRIAGPRLIASAWPSATIAPLQAA
jgi:hypothetical protein